MKATPRARSSGKMGGYIALFCLLLAALAAAIHWQLKDNTLGDDFYTFWVAGRAAFIEHHNPYGAETTLQSQLGIYKRPALPSEDQVAFAYPPYSLFALLPLVWMPFDWAQAVWLAFNTLALISLVFFLFPRAPAWIGISLPFFYPFTFGLLLGNFAVLIGCLALGMLVLLLVKGERGVGVQTTLGLTLAWCTCKPQLIWLFAGVILLFALRERLWRLIIAFSGGLVLFWALSWLLVPGWLNQWLARVGEYARYVQSQPVAGTFLGMILPVSAVPTVLIGLEVLLGAATAALTILWWRGRLDWLKLLAWCGLVGYFIHPHPLSYEAIVFIIPLTLWAVTRKPSPWTAAAWFGLLALFWISLGISQAEIYHGAIIEWPVIGYALWVVGVFAGKNDRNSVYPV